MNKADALAKRAHEAARSLVGATTESKNSVLMTIADLLTGDMKNAILAANQQDVAAGEKNGLSTALLDRLRLTPDGLQAMADGVQNIVALADPVGEIETMRAQPNGLMVGKMAVPLGVILMVYESRPNVTIDAAALCLKASNAVILRGGKEAKQSNALLANVVRTALKSHGLPEDGVIFVEEPDRQFLYELLKANAWIDLVIPRGGTSLIRAVDEHATIPVVQHYQGICHVYVHEDADLQKALAIAVNAKVQRPGVCNAMETLVVDRALASEFLAMVTPRFLEHGVELRGCDVTKSVLEPALNEAVTSAQEADYDTEFLSKILAIKVVEDFQEGLTFLREHGSRHTETIVTENHSRAMQFLKEVDASCVLVNASTRFNDGGQLGLGAELGISTTKLHAYGPMGLKELCTHKFVVFGDGHIRGAVS